MDEYLSREDVLFDRGEDENLLPVDVEVEALPNKPKIKVLPISIGKWKELIKLEPVEQDKMILKNHLLEPKIDDKDYKFIKPTVFGAMSNAIVALTLDITQKESKEKTNNENNKDVEVALKKKLKETGED